MNKVILMGRLTKDPEVKQTPSNIAVCSFTIACDRRFKSQNGERQSDFITCVAWRQTAEFICRNFTKGRLILVEGDLRTRSYDDRNHPDVKHYVTEVFVENASFGETKSSAGGGYSQGGYEPAPPPANYGSGNGNSYRSQSYQPQSAPASVADINDFEEVVSDASDLPF
jgi:single-strand DNA-binding protein